MTGLGEQRDPCRSRTGNPCPGGEKITETGGESRFGLKAATRATYSSRMELSPYTAATLATDGHVYCVGTLAQCLRRWNRLPDQNKVGAFLKMGRDGVSPTILRAEQISELAGNAKLIRG